MSTTEPMGCDKRGEGDWISLNVDNEQGHFVDFPVLAKYHMQNRQLADGTIHFVDEPQIFGEGKVDDLIDLLCDEERHGLVFVAGTASSGGVPFGSFVKAVRDWPRQVYGLSQVIGLDPAATASFAAHFGAFHHAPAWPPPPLPPLPSSAPSPRSACRSRSPGSPPRRRPSTGRSPTSRSARRSASRSAASRPRGSRSPR